MFPTGHGRRGVGGFWAAVCALALTLPLALVADGAAQAASAQDDLNLGTAKVHWLDRTTVAWPHALGTAADTHRLVYDPAGELTVRDGELSGDARPLDLHRDPAGLDRQQRVKWPHLVQGYDVYRLSAKDAAQARTALRGQVLAVAADEDGTLSAATGVQNPGVLDDLYADATEAQLGPTVRGERTTLAVWAPTARSVALEIAGRTVPMRRDARTGVWRAWGASDAWRGAAYRYRVAVWAPSVQRMVVNHVTDPYATALTADSARSVVADLNDSALAPEGWDRLRKPEPVALRRAQVQELHVRDFSRDDPSAPHRGEYGAFTEQGSDGMRALRRLADAGTTHVHLLPAFDFGTVPERRADRTEPPCDLTEFGPASAKQQKCVAKSADGDSFNWGYDPVHFTVPEGSYAADPEGPARTEEFREMVQGLNKAGLRVVMDVVYNHTVAAGQQKGSVLDRIVPGYYQRLTEDGEVADSTCCPGTAPEHAMMGKLVTDSVVTWAKQYKVDGFRFDLMGHHPKSQILQVRRALDRLTPERDGVDGKSVVLYGEGWNFGEVADDARFEQATQQHMAGTGVATFSDRARDAVRGGAPFDEDPRVQGFASGLYTDPNSSKENGTRAEQLARLRHYQDLLKVGLSGSLADYAFTDATGHRVTGADIDYDGQPAGYAKEPGDALSYVDAHDNETLYDALAYKLPRATAPRERARMQTLGMATALLSQGPNLSHAGSERLRSKSLDRNSFDSGDWFNALYWDCSQGNGFGRGLPPAADNETDWPYAKGLLSDPKLVPGCTEIEGTERAYRDLLRIRSTEQAFHARTADEVARTLRFPLAGAKETPGVVTAEVGNLVVVFNATPETAHQRVADLAGKGYRLHPVQAKGADEVVRGSQFDRATGEFTVPGRSVAVFRQG